MLLVLENTNLRTKMKLAACLLTLAISAFAAQIKDIANVVGVRENQLIGYGLVVGLNGSGDGSSYVYLPRLCEHRSARKSRLQPLRAGYVGRFRAGFETKQKGRLKTQRDRKSVV